MTVDSGEVDGEDVGQLLVGSRGQRDGHLGQAAEIGCHAAQADRAAASVPTGVLAACSRSSGTSSLPQSTTSSSGSKPRIRTVSTPARR